VECEAVLSCSEDAVVTERLTVHPIAELFPELPAEDFRALVEDIRRHGVKVPIVVYNGQIIDGCHRYRACEQLGKKCPTVEWDGRDPWLEVQSRNLLRRHLRKEQVYAIRLLAAARFPALAAPMLVARDEARQRQAQAKGQPRGVKVLFRSSDRHRESAEVIGAQLGVSGGTIKRVERVARQQPELLPQIAAGALSAAKATRQIRAPQLVRAQKPGINPPPATLLHALEFNATAATRQLRSLIRQQWLAWPHDHRLQFIRALQAEVHDLVYALTVSQGRDGTATAAQSLSPASSGGRR
jgi:ParB-like chromosome segregation protein Spo0J